MPKRQVKITEIKEEAVSYDDVVSDIKPVEIVEESPVEEAVTIVSPSTEEEPPIPLKQVSAKGTCGGCGKTMTMKNLKYAHALICSARDTQPDEEVFEQTKPFIAVEESAPTKLKRTKSFVPEEEVSVAEPEKVSKAEKTKVKAKRRSRTVDDAPESTVSVVEPVRSRAAKKAELYDKLAANALA